MVARSAASVLALTARRPFAHSSKREHRDDGDSDRGADCADQRAEARLQAAIAVALQIDERVTDDAAAHAGQEDGREGKSASAHRRGG